MVVRNRKRWQPDDRRLAARLHDISSGLAIGIGLLKGRNESTWSGSRSELQQTIDVFEEVLAELRHLLRGVSEGADGRGGPVNVRESLVQEAKSLGVDLDLRLVGQEDWLAAGQAELMRLVGREAIRNVKRHSGASVCRITIDLATCPFVMAARDWGAGNQPNARPRRGLALLESLARDLGASLQFSSQPGLGVELTLIGPRCGLAAGAGLRSVVADESVSSRKRVASTRPSRAVQQQIT